MLAPNRLLTYLKWFLRVVTKCLLTIFLANACLALYDYYYVQRLNPAYLRISKVQDFDTRTASSFGYQEYGEGNFQLAAPPHKIATAWERTGISISPSPNTNIVLCNEHGNYVTYKSDMFGFRNNDKSIYTDFDVMLIGDSYAMGYCEEPTATISGFLTAQGSRTLNLGLGGAGPFTYAKVLEAFSTYLRDDSSVVILSYFNNDSADAKIEAQTILGQKDAQISLDFLKQPRSVYVPLQAQPVSNYQKFASEECESECGSHYDYWKSNKRNFYHSIWTGFYIRMMFKRVVTLLDSSDQPNYKRKLSPPTLDNPDVRKGLESIKAVSQKISKNNQNQCLIFVVYANGQFNQNQLNLYLDVVENTLADTWLVKLITDEDLGSPKIIYRQTGGHLGPTGYERMSGQIKQTLSDHDCEGRKS